MNFKERCDVSCYKYNIYLRCCATSHYKAMTLLLVGSYFKKKKKKNMKKFRRCNLEKLDVKMFRSRKWDKKFFVNFILKLEKNG